MSLPGTRHVFVDHTAHERHWSGALPAMNYRKPIGTTLIEFWGLPSMMRSV